MEERLDSILGLAIFFSPIITPFLLVAFTPIRHLRQPLRFFVIGIASGIVAVFLSGLAMLHGTIGSRGFLFIVGISTVGAFLMSFLFSSERITEKTRDELIG